MAHNLTRWIEDADARSFNERAGLDRTGGVGENHYVHLGDRIANLSTWVQRGVSRQSLAAIGCHALAYLRQRPIR